MERTDMPRLLVISLLMALLGAGCTIIIQAPIVCPEGSTLKEGRCLGQVFGVLGSDAGLSDVSVSGDRGAEQQIASLPEGGSEDWDNRVSGILIATYDSDGSGEVDTAAEVDQIDCGVFKAMDRATKQGDDVNLMSLYGFANGYLWAGDALGFNLSVRERLAERMSGCGLST